MKKTGKKIKKYTLKMEWLGKYLTFRNRPGIRRFFTPENQIKIIFY